MTFNDGIVPLTIGHVSTIDNTWYQPGTTPYTNGYPWWGGGNISISLPTWCSGETHVFACEHANKCQCGKASRVPEPKPCGACGKR